MVLSHAKPRVAHQGVDLLEVGLQLAGHLERLLEVAQVTLPPVNDGDIAPAFQLLERLGGVLFFVREEDDLGGMVLEQMRDDAKSNARRAACNNVSLVS